MTCEQLLQYLSDYIDNDLDETLTAAAQDHLATCPNCRVVLDTTLQSIFLVHTYGTRTIPKERKARLWQEIETAFDGKPTTKFERQ